MRRLSTRTSIGAALAAALVAIAAGASLAAPGGRGVGLDRSYGTEGVVHIDLATLLTPPASPEITGFAPAADGTVFVLLRFIGCHVREGCGRLFRFDSDGVRDLSFGADGSVPVPGTATVAPVVDDSGGPVVAAPGRDRLDLVRFVAGSGEIDPSFGGPDGVSVRCRCRGAKVHLSAAPGDKLLVEVDGGFGRRHGVTLIRLSAGGRLDRSFGGDGSVSFPVRVPKSVSVRAVAGNGAIYLGGSSCCAARRVSVLRVSPHGRLDARFARTEARSARRLNRLGEFPDLSAIVPRPDGSVDLLGNSDLARGFDLRLRPTGRRQAGFGIGGLALLPFLVESAVLGSRGGIVGVGSAPGDYAHRLAFRERADGRIDPRFGGGRGIRLRIGGYPTAIAALAGRRALVTDEGNLTCRGDCEQAPSMVRLIEP